MSADRKSTSINWRPWAVVIAVLLLGGMSYRLAMARLRPLMTRPITLAVPLENFPPEIQGWKGKSVPLPPEIKRAAGVDDYLNRFYANGITGQWANLYVGYCGRPRSMSGHRPQICYPANGWVHDSTDQDELALPSGEKLPCLIHRFHREADSRVVLNYYVLNGTATSDEDRFAGFGYRLPNIEGDPAYYVAQVQVASRSESAVRELAGVTAQRILEFLPDRRGKVRAASTKPARDAALTPGLVAGKGDAETR